MRDGTAGGEMGTAWGQIPTKVRLVVRDGSVEGVFKFVKGFQLPDIAPLPLRR